MSVNKTSQNHAYQPSCQTATMRPPSQPLMPISDHDTNSVMRTWEMILFCSVMIFWEQNGSWITVGVMMLNETTMPIVSMFWNVCMRMKVAGNSGAAWAGMCQDTNTSYHLTYTTNITTTTTTYNLIIIIQLCQVTQNMSSWQSNLWNNIFYKKNLPNSEFMDPLVVMRSVNNIISVVCGQVQTWLRIQ